RTVIPEELREHYNIFVLGGDLYNIELILLCLVFGELLACKKSDQMQIKPLNQRRDGCICRVVRGAEIYDCSYQIKNDRDSVETRTSQNELINHDIIILKLK